MNLRLLGFAGLFQTPNLHPAVVHFPLVLLPIAFVFFAAGKATDNSGVRLAGRACLWLAVFSAMAAVFTGSQAVNDLPEGADVRALLRAHRALAFLTTFVTIALAGWASPYPKHRPQAAWLLLTLLALDCLLVMQTGDLGARMVYMHGAGTKATRFGRANGSNPPDRSNEEPRRVLTGRSAR